MQVLRLSLALGMIVLSGCSFNSSDIKQPDVNDAKILEAINKSAVVIADSQRVTAESQNAIRSMQMTQEQKSRYAEEMAYIPPNMERMLPLFVRNEELEKAAKLLALLTEYDFNVVNPSMRPRDGVLITIQSQGRTGYDLAREMGTQAGVKADLNILPYSTSDRKSSKFGLIEVVYK